MDSSTSRCKPERSKYTILKRNGLWPVRGRIDPSLRGIKAWSHPASVAWREWVSKELVVGETLVLLTPCSNVKPYPKSPMSRKIRGVLRRLGLWNSHGGGLSGSPSNLAWLYVSDLLGLVPYERSHEYPTCCYEFPPSFLIEHTAFLDEIRVVLKRFFSRNVEIKVIVAFLPRFYRHIIEPIFDDFSQLKVKWIRYHIFYGHKDLEANIREVIDNDL